MPTRAATSASHQANADAGSAAIAAELERARATEGDRDSARTRARAGWILASRLQGQAGDCLAWHKASGACLGTIGAFNALIDATAPPWQDIDPDSRPRSDTVSLRRKIALARMLEDAFLEMEAASLGSVNRPIGPGGPIPDESRKRKLYAALEPILFSSRPPDRFRVSGATDTAAFRAWLAEGNLSRGLKKGGPSRGWSETFTTGMPAELAAYMDGIIPGTCLGPVPAAFGSWAACRMPGAAFPRVPFESVLPFLGEMLASGAGIPRFDSAAITDWIASHPHKAQDTVRVRVWLTPKGSKPGALKLGNLPDTVGLTGRNTTLDGLPTALARYLDSLRMAGAWRHGELLDCGEWPLGRWRARLLGATEGIGPGVARAARARAWAALIAPWQEAWDRERAAIAESAREASRDRIRARFGYAPDSLSAQAAKWATDEAWVDSARILGQ